MFDYKSSKLKFFWIFLKVGSFQYDIFISRYSLGSWFYSGKPFASRKKLVIPPAFFPQLYLYVFLQVYIERENMTFNLFIMPLVSIERRMTVIKIFSKNIFCKEMIYKVKKRKGNKGRLLTWGHLDEIVASDKATFFQSL